MTERFIGNERDREMFVRFIEAHKLPFVGTIVSGRRRTLEQNKLQRLWMNEISEQLGDQTPEEVRGYCKLAIGVPILRAENEKFRERYDDVIRPMPYEKKILLMMEPLDTPVTRIMTTGQKTKYLDEILRKFSEMGITLTVPDDGLMASVGKAA